MALTNPRRALQEAFQAFSVPKPDSHKGENGKLLIIGGSSLFHSAVLWSAEMAALIVDLVHFASTDENNEIFLNLKTKFRNGIVVQQKDIYYYATEDDCILVGPGMLREDGDEARYTRELTKNLIEKFPDKQFVIDAGAMQLMEPDLLLKLSKKAVVTPHQKEFKMLFGMDIINLTLDEKKKIAQEMARKYNCIILLKAIVDIVTDGDRLVSIEGGNAGLTKGGTGDTLASLIASLSTTNDSFTSCVLASFLLKSAAEELEKKSGNWFTTSELISQIPKTMKRHLVSAKSPI